MTGGERRPVYSRAVREAMTTWATRFDGGCEHVAQQYGRPGDLRSGCWSCTTALNGWDRSGPCDLCGALCHPEGAWSWPPRETGGVQVFLRACDTCSVFESDNDKMEMTDMASCCDMCNHALSAARTPDAWRFHRACLVAASHEALTAAANHDDARRMRVRALRARLTGKVS